MPETLLALLLRPLTLETASVKGMVPPSVACGQANVTKMQTELQGRVSKRHAERGGRGMMVM